MDSISDIGKIVRKKRKNLKLNQKDLAEVCNVGTRFISELENGKKTLEVDKVFKVIRSVGLNINVSERRI